MLRPNSYSVVSGFFCYKISNETMKLINLDIIELREEELGYSD